MNVSPFLKVPTADVLIAVPLDILTVTPETVGLANFASFIFHGIAFEKQPRGGQGQ